VDMCARRLFLLRGVYSPALSPSCRTRMTMCHAGHASGWDGGTEQLSSDPASRSI
jgi:hypothetical protein